MSSDLRRRARAVPWSAAGRGWSQRASEGALRRPDGSAAGSGTLAADAPLAPDRRSRWVAVGVVLVGSYAAVLNITVVGVALPAMAGDLGGGGLFGLDWVVTSFLVGVMLALPVTGWLADRFGRKVVYTASLGVFGLGALGCAAAPTMDLVVVARFVQGLGGGAVMPIGMAVVFDLFPPHRRGLGLGVWGVAIMAAPAAGPPLGGWVVTVVSWRWIFLIFVTVAAVAVALAVRWLPDVGHREARRLDVVGWALAAVGVAVVVLGFRQIGLWGPTSPATIATGLTALVTLAVLVRRSLHRAEPIIEFRMLAVPTYAVAMAVVSLLSLAQFAQLTFLPVELQVVRGLDARQVGLLLAPAAIGMAAMMPIGGWFVDRVGARAPVVIGLGLIANSLWQLAHLQPDGSQASLVRILVIQGVGMGLVFIPTTVSAMNSLPARFVAQASAVNNLTRQLGGAIGIAVLSAVLVADLGAVAPASPVIDQAQAAYNRVFLIAFWFVTAAALTAVFLPGRKRARQHHAERSEELADLYRPNGATGTPRVRGQTTEARLG